MSGNIKIENGVKPLSILKIKIAFYNIYCTPKSVQLVAPIIGSAKSVYAELP